MDAGHRNGSLDISQERLALLQEADAARIVFEENDWWTREFYTDPQSIDGKPLIHI